MVKHKIFSLLFSITVFFISGTQLFAGDNLIKAWNSFKDNQYTQSNIFCDDEIKKSGSDINEALLLKALIADIYSDKMITLECMKKIVESSKDLNPFIFSMWSSSAFATAPIYDNDDYIDFWENLSKNTQLNGTIKSWINESLSKAYQNKYEFKDAKEVAKKLGAIPNWQIAGTFENISESGFDKNFGALEHPEAGYKFINKNGAEITWFNNINSFEGAWIDLTSNFIITNSIIYAQTFFESEIEGIFQLRIGTSGSLKVWINDLLVLSESQERNNGLDTYIAKIKIHKGNNRILLQIGSSEINRNNFLARITDQNGEILNGLTFTPKYSPYQKETSFIPEVLPNFAEEFYNNQIKADSTKLLNYILLSNCLQLSEKLPEARHVLLQAQKLAPNSSFILNQLLDVYIRLQDRTDLSLVLEKLRKVDPNFPGVLEYDFEEAIKNEKYEDAEWCLTRLEVFLKDKVKLYSLKIRLNAVENKTEYLIALIEAIYNEFPNSLEAVNLKYTLESKLKKDFKSGIKILKKYVSKNNNYLAISDLASDYANIGENSDFFSLLQDNVENNPNDIGSLYKIATHYFDLGKYELAEEYLKKCIAIAPYVASYHHELGNTYKEMDKTSFAIQEYNECIKYNPYHYIVREKLRKLNGKKSLFSYLNEPDLFQIYKDNLDKPFNKSDNAVTLINQTNRVVYSGGAFEERCFVLIKVLSPKGIDNYKEYNIFIYPNQDYIIEKYFVLKKNGSQLKAEVNKNQVIFPNLEEGDAIMLIYKIQNYQFGNLSKFLWDKTIFDSYSPCLEKKYSLLISSDEKFDYVWSNSDYKPEITKVDEYTIYTWHRTNKQNIISEMYAPNIVDYAEMLDISSIKNWDFISKWYLDIVNSKAKSKYETKEVIKTLFPTGTPADKLAAAKSIYEYIVKNIRYSYVTFLQSGIIPQKASDVLNSKMGDCKDVSTLFVTLCREIGLDANWVLICTRDYGRNFLKLPSIDFNHCIATVTIEGKKYYVELTSDKIPFGTISGKLIGSLALEINDKKDNNLFILNPQARNPNSVKRNIDVKFVDQSMKVEVNTVKYGGFAATQRDNYRDLSPEEQKKEMSEAIGSDYTQLTLLDLIFGKDLNTLADSCSYKYSFVVDNVFTDISGFSAFKIPYTDGLEPSQAFSTNLRKYPFDLYQYSRPDSTMDEIKIYIPDGMKPVEKQSPVSIETKYGSYYLDFTYGENVITVNRKLIRKIDIASPEEFTDVKNFFQSVIKYDTKQIAFQKL